MRIVAIILLLAVIYFAVPPVKVYADRKYAEIQRDKEIARLHVLQSEGKITITVTDKEL